MTIATGEAVCSDSFESKAIFFTNAIALFLRARALTLRLALDLGCRVQIMLLWQYKHVGPVPQQQ